MSPPSPDDPEQVWIRETVLKILQLFGERSYEEVCTVLTVTVAAAICLNDTGREAESADGFARELKKLAINPDIGRWIRQYVTQG